MSTQAVDSHSRNAAAPFIAALLAFAIALGAGFGGQAVAAQLVDKSSDCWEFRDGQVGIYLWCAGDRDLGGWCAGLVDNEMTASAEACAVPALMVQKVPAAGVAGIALGVAAACFVLACIVSGRRRASA